MTDQAEIKTRTRTVGPLTGQLKGYLKAEEAASIIGVSVGTLAQWRRKEMNIAFYTSGGRIGYKKTDVDAFTAKYMALVCISPK